MRDIGKAVAAINRVLDGTPLGRFYEIRAELNGGRKRSGGLFQVVHGDGELTGYAFHWGGRSELQFNIGFEDGAYFRYGVAFSLEPDRNLVDPLSALIPKISRLNAALPEFPILRGLRMWSYSDDSRSADGPVATISPKLAQLGNFIFIGERVEVSSTGITPNLLQRVSDVLNALLPLYERVESNDAMQAAPYKVARLCWNTDYWQQPTGRSGKARNERAFETEHGFGHEEWIFDHSRLIGDSKYGFIQALNRSHAKYAGQQLNLLLYTIDNKSKARYWIGAIRDADVLTGTEAQAAVRKYKKSGWIKEMQAQVESQGLDASSLSVANPIELLNFRYEPEKLTLFHPPIQFPADDLPSAYYGNFQEVPASQGEIVAHHDGPAAVTEANIQRLKSTRKAFASEKEIDLVHKRWQKELAVSLRKELPKAKIHIEARMFGHQVDVVVEQEGKRIFVELKTKSVVRQVIREALAQLLEYSYWPPVESRADALVIVGAGEADASDLGYLSLLRERFQIPVHYRQYRHGSIVGAAELVTSIVG